MTENTNDNQQVTAALEQFCEWTMPWAYIREALATKGLAPQDGALVEEIWQEANSPAHWIGPSFQSKIDIATAALKTRYSWVGNDVIRNLVRGASYMWK